jgi:hypothetical protein
MQLFRHWAISLSLLFTLGLVNGSGAFLIIPTHYHGLWTIPTSKDGLFLVEPQHVSARFKSAELRLQPETLKPQEHGHELFLHHVTVTRMPSSFDLRTMWRNIGYFHAVRKNGISLRTVLMENDLLHVEWSINEKYSGKVILKRQPLEQNVLPDQT